MAVYLESKKAIEKLEKISFKYDLLMKRSLAFAISDTRKRSAKELIPNRTGSYNPYQARRLQPAMPGKLTSRTGKLKYMLKYGTDKPKNYWGKPTKNKLYREKKYAGLQGLIRRLDGDKENIYNAKLRVKINPSARMLFKTNFGMPKETNRTLAVRFNWDNPAGIRGESRPFFRTVVDKTQFSLKRYIESRGKELEQI